MRILVTGASGNVGSHVVPELVRRGHVVRAFAHSAGRGRRTWPAGVEVARGDITDPVALAGAVDGVDAVIHLAAVIPPAADAHPERAREVNVDGTANVVAACRARPKPPRLHVHFRRARPHAGPDPAPARGRSVGGHRPVHRAQDRV